MASPTEQHVYFLQARRTQRSCHESLFFALLLFSDRAAFRGDLIALMSTKERAGHPCKTFPTTIDLSFDLVSLKDHTHSAHAHANAH
jgi:hypothetical protein